MAGFRADSELAVVGVALLGLVCGDARVIDDKEGNTVCAASTLDESIKSENPKGNDRSAAGRVGALLAERAKAKGLEKLQDSVQPFPAALGREIIERELSIRIEDVFSALSAAPASFPSLCSPWLSSRPPSSWPCWPSGT